MSQNLRNRPGRRRQKDGGRPVRSFGPLPLLIAVLACWSTAVLLTASSICPPDEARPQWALAPQRTTVSPRSARRRKGRSKIMPELGQPIAASYARFSSDMQRDESNLDQQRKCREAADRNGHQILPEYEFSDEAISGTKRKRKGLDAVLAAAKAREIQVLYFFSLSRLARESVITMPILKQLVYKHDVRVISVTEGIDTAREGWEVIATVLSLLHERYIKELGENVFRGQEGAVLAGYAVGDHCFGYTTTPIPGTESQRKGRAGKPRKTYVISESEASWVIRIFHWYVAEQRAISWIVRELNHRGAPQDHRATTPHWGRAQVITVLSNAKYTGVWAWGESKNVRDPDTGNIRQEARSTEECQPWVRHFPHLRLTEDETFNTAQQRLNDAANKMATYRDDAGVLRGSPPGGASESPRHLLEGLIHCRCGAPFYIAGSHGKYLQCSAYLKGVCDVKTQLSRQLAQSTILDVVGKCILHNPPWFDAVFAEVQSCVARRSEEHPAQLAAWEAELAELERKIACLVDQVEAGQADPDIGKRLKERRSERDSLLRQIDRLRREQGAPISPPTRDWLSEQLAALGQSIAGNDPAAAIALRNLLGGKIVVEPHEHPRRKRQYFRGRCTILSSDLARIFAEGGQMTGASDSEAQCAELVFEFLNSDPFSAQAAEAKALYDQGLMNSQIAHHLGVKRAYVTKLLRYWFESHDMTMPDGRARRKSLVQKHNVPPLYQRIADEVRQLEEEGLLLQDIAQRLDCDRETVNQARIYWYKARQLPVPDGRTRRRELPKKPQGESPSDGESEQ